MIFGKRKDERSGAAVAEPKPADPAIERARELVARGSHFEAIDLLNEANRRSRSTATEVEIRRIRNLAGMALLEDPPTDPGYPEPAAEVPAPDPDSRLPEITPAELTPELLRGAMLQSGALLIRGLMDPAKAERLAAGIDHSFEIRKQVQGGATDADGYYDELDPEAPFIIGERSWIEEGGGVLAVDSPRLMFDMLEAFEEAGLRSVIADYLGEKPAISGQKCTLRKATPDVAGAWHQDGAFLGEVRALNVWLALSRCGDVAPGMDVVPRRLDDFVATGTEGTYLDFQVSQATAEEAAGEIGIVRPIFNPGDALLFDDLMLHQTGSDPSMPNPRYAIESWFFGPSAYPENYVPIAF
ncbi:MAG TPA: hypothetical protein VFH44_12145 [Solirubrobacterales bacterium]|nr:hypothetical protein [Solirubrobacterales bacterium]